MGRERVYYWKCDRPQSFFALKPEDSHSEAMCSMVSRLLERYFGTRDFTFQPAGGQGNHLTYSACHGGKHYFIRLENGPEKDDYMEVEAYLCTRVREEGIPTPEIYAVDASYSRYPFAYQIMEYEESADLNQLYKKGDLNIEAIMHQAGGYIARWQNISTENFGFFHTDCLRQKQCLKGLCNSYRDYYMLNLDRHLHFLSQHNFIGSLKTKAIKEAILNRSSLLDIKRGCLVHKDIALWNLLGNTNEIKKVIDWDDAISGDPTDDISLMACFHNGQEVNRLIEGYKEYKPLPDDFEERFWLHLLRNMIFKAVIRVGAGYFDRSDNFFLVGASGDALRRFTLERVELAYNGLFGNVKIEAL
jgi:fructosamine-3-kinase